MLLEREPATPWSKAVGMRNMLIHGYYDVDPAVVWDTIESDLPELRIVVRRMLQGFE